MGKFRDLTGMRFGRLIVIERAEDHIRKDGHKRTRWLCKCDCGNVCTVNADNLTRGMQISCGCHRKEALKKSTTTHGMADSRLYYVWYSMRKRCTNSNVKAFPQYGGRGITVCDEWENDFKAFYDWAIKNGYDENAKKGVCEIDRIDNNLGYSPENCRISTRQEQMNNIRCNHWIEFNGEKHTLAQWGRITGMPASKIYQRICKLGWSPERALTTA